MGIQPGILSAFFDSALDRLRNIVSKLNSINTSLGSLSTGAPVIGSVTTANPGTNWTTLASAVVKTVTLLNETGTNIDIRLNGAGTFLTLSTNQGIDISGLSNANIIGVKRSDNSNTTVTLKYLAN